MKNESFHRVSASIPGPRAASITGNAPQMSPSFVNFPTGGA